MDGRINLMKINRSYVFFLALMTAFAASLYFVEVFIPRPMLFMKIGLSNIVVLLLVFCRFYREAMIVALSKSIIGAFFTGTLFSPMFVLSIGGTVFSCVFMIVFSRLLSLKKEGLSIIGLSIIGAFVHLVTQLILVRLLIIHSDSIFTLYPVIAVTSVVTGFLTGFIGNYVLKYIDLRSYYDKITELPMLAKG